MRSAVIVATLAALSLMSIGAAPADTGLQAVFARMDEASATFKGLTADVKKVTHTDVVNENEIDSGSIKVRQPKPHDYHMLIDFSQPNARTVEITTSRVDVYYPKPNTIQRVDLGRKYRSQAEQFFRLGFGSNSKELTDAFTVSMGGPETVEGEKTTRIELVPKSQELRNSFPRFELWVSDRTGIAIQQKMWQQGKDFSLATYTKMKLNPNLSESDVRLNAPKSARIEIINK